MSKHGFPFYVEQLEQILAVTKMLNEHGEKIPSSDDFFLKVQLCDSCEGKVIGEWSDEIGPDCWEFRLVSEKEEKPKIQMHNGVVGARGISRAEAETEADRFALYAANNKNVQLD